MSCGLRSRPDANPRGRRSRPVLVSEHFLQGESIRGGVCDPAGPGQVRSSERGEHHLPVVGIEQAGRLRGHPQLCRQHSAASHRSQGHQ